MLRSGRVTLWKVTTFLAVTVAVFACFRSEASTTQAAPNTPFRGLDGYVWMQTSAEYKACCRQAYKLAETMLKKRADGPRTTDRKLAVILDLDETVLDNSAFQVSLMKAGLFYSSDRWKKWEADDKKLVRPIPGAQKFLSRAKELGVVVFYISNRKEEQREGTKAVLTRLDIAVPDSQLLLRQKDKDDNKSERRKQVEEKYDVALIVGDNLRDFDERFKFNKERGIEGRSAEVEKTQDKFGTEWIILPNCSYGEFLINSGFGNSTDDAKRLNKNGDYPIDVPPTQPAAP